MSDSSLTMERAVNNRRAELIQPGDLVAGKYRVQTILGRDRGLLVDATHIETDHRVAIKLLPAGHGNDKEVERFRREGRTLAKLESEHVARIIDVGSHADGSLYLVRQYLDGIDLTRYLRQAGPLPLAEAVLLMAQAAEAVAEAHGHGIILRELGPSHLFLTQRAGGAPLLKVIDFGTAKPQPGGGTEGGGELTATAMFGISPYASPELVRKAKNVDLRMDVWSLGAIFYEMLAGRPPFTGELAMLMLQIAKEDVAPLTSLRSDLPPEIDQIIGWAMAKDVDARFRNVHAFMHALLPYAPPEAQMLVDRIGHITRAARMRRKGGGAEPAVRPPPVVITPMVAMTPAMAMPLATASRLNESSALGSLPAAPESKSSDAPATAPIADAPVAVAASIAPLPMPAPATAARPKRDWSGLANGLAFLSGSIPVLLGVLVLSVVQPAKGSVKPVSTEQGHAAAEAPAAPLAAHEAPAAPPAKPKEPEAGEKEAVSAPHETEAAPRAKRTSARAKRSSARRTPEAPKATSSDSEEDLEMEAEGPSSAKQASASSSSSSAAGTGTLFAVVTGGSCAFSVNGAAKGTSTSVKLALPPGTYSVGCKSTSGEAISKSVTVKEGQAVFATFKSHESS